MHKWLSATAGMNINRTVYRLFDNFFDAVDGSGTRKFAPQYSPRVSAVWECGAKQALFVGAGQGFSPKATNFGR